MQVNCWNTFNAFFQKTKSCNCATDNCNESFGTAGSLSSSLVEDEPSIEEDFKKARALEMEAEKPLRMVRKVRKELERKNSLKKKVGKSGASTVQFSLMAAILSAVLINQL